MRLFVLIWFIAIALLVPLAAPAAAFAGGTPCIVARPAGHVGATVCTPGEQR